MARLPICIQCGALRSDGRWWPPLIGTENFCSKSCVHTYVTAHRFNGQAQAIHTDDCRHHLPASVD